ncbi:acyl-CoA synthetase [Parasphingorhabdus litoris]|uniref:Acyl-CoA synthetase n=1 Tax=Parasphingorhabdus litoris TaxID=394733 RepID=A0ABN1AJ83_9SPHN|nr:acyl-CoA synthetase [Parasphingorhabdus litoris]
MHPYLHAQENPDKPAVIMASTGAVETYAELDKASNRLAHLFRKEDLQIGDTVAVLLDNHPKFFDFAWAAQRAGLYYVAIPSRLTAAEVSYILSDSGATLLISSDSKQGVVDELHKLNPDVKVFLFGVDDNRAIEPVLAALPDGPIDDERHGTDMLYSSGTTGRPKGVRIPFPENEDIAGPNPLVMMAQGAFGFQPGCTYLSPAPLYHAAPLRWCMTVHKMGGTVIVMEKFDPEQALALIEKYKVDASQWVPTHFSRMLKLPEETRAKYDVSSLTCAVHAAAPCPIPVKEKMIEWWGPIIREYYAGSEGNGFTFINSEDWLTHKGSVGKALLGIVHICDENDNEVPVGEEGQIYFEGGAPVKYHNDPEKTKAAHNKHGWTSLGDVGKVDEDGFLYLTDRKSFMIISGGVNIYPQEIENLLVTHPKVLDAAVIGAPDEDMGEKVVAVIQPMDMADANDDFAQELEVYLRQSLSGVKVPRQIDFRAELPRVPTGKLYKRLLRDEYWGKTGSRIV